MIPRAVEQVFRVAEELKHKGWEYRMEGQFLEIVGFGQNKSDSLIKLRRILSIMKLSTTSSWTPQVHLRHYPSMPRAS